MNDLYNRVPLSTITNVPKNKAGRYIAYKNYYWIVDKDNNVLFYRGAAQCNMQEVLVKMIIKKKDYPGVGYVFVETAYVSESLEEGY